MSLLRKLTSPSSVALIGVSKKTGKGALNPLQVLLDFGYKGKIYPVNPNANVILGFECYRTVQDIPEIPELAVIMVRRELVPEILRECAKKGITTAVIISDGFAEADSKGKQLQEELTEICKNTGIRVLGPNSMGVVNHYSLFTTSFVKVSSKKAPVAFVGQSGLFVQGFSNLHIGKAIDIGNGCDIGFSELVSELLDDPEIEIIALHIEELKDPNSFLNTIRKKGLKKPIVIFKSGKYEKAKKAIMSHSGSIAADYMFYKAFFSSSGIILVKSTQELEDVVYLLSKINIPSKRNVGIITPSGGAGIICIDTVDENGFSVANLSEKSLNEIKKVYPEYYEPSNPLDIMSATFRHGYRQVYTKALEVMTKDENVDIIFCINGAPTLKTISSFVKERPVKKPVISWVIGDYREEEVKALTSDAPVAVFSNPERAFKALDMCMRNQEERKIISEDQIELLEIKEKDKIKIKDIFKETRRQGLSYIFSETFSILEILSLRIPKSLIFKSLAIEENKVFEHLSPPVCIKFETRYGLHKKKEGLMSLGIVDGISLKKAAEEIASRIKKEDIRSILIQEMVESGVELFLGVKRDKRFGPIMLIGKGGSDVEVYKDIEPLMIPFSRSQAIYTFKKTKIGKTISQEHIKEFVDIMIAMSSLCASFSEIKEIDLNPIILNQEGTWIVDAKIFI